MNEDIPPADTSSTSYSAMDNTSERNNGSNDSHYESRADANDSSRRRRRSFDEQDGYRNRGGSPDHYRDAKRPRYNDDRGRDRNYRRPSHYTGRSRGPPAPPPESESDRKWRLAKKCIIELGEKTPLGDAYSTAEELTEELSNASQRIIQELEQDPEVKTNALGDLVLRGVTRLAHKTHLYASLVGLVNQQKPDFGRYVLQTTCTRIQTLLMFFFQSPDDSRSYTIQEIDERALKLRLFVRFLTSLVSVHVTDASDVLRILDSLQSVCTSELDDIVPMKEFFASVVLDALTHGGKALQQADDAMFTSLVSRCSDFISFREEGQESSWLVRRVRLHLLYEPEEDLVSFCQSHDLLSIQYAAFSSLHKQESDKSIYETPGVVDPVSIFPSTFTRNANEHPIDAAVTFEAFDPSKTPSYPLFFRIFTAETGAQGAAIHALPLASYLSFRSSFLHTFQTFDPKPAMAAKQLIALAKDISSRMEGIKGEFLLLETLLSTALASKTRKELIYYCSVLRHLVKTDARAVSPALATVVELLFRELPSMSSSTIDSFVLLFSHFLSNFEFKWAWARWTFVLDARQDDPQRVFVSSVLERCVRLSYRQLMQEALPSDLHTLLPPSPQPVNRFANDSTLSSAYEEISSKLKTHPPADVLVAFLQEQIDTKEELGVVVATELLWTSMLEAGAATFTHIRLLLERYPSGIETFSDEMIVLQTLAKVWAQSPQHVALIANMMLRQRRLTLSTVAKWLFTPEVVPQFSWPYIWEVAFDALALYADDEQAMDEALTMIFTGFSTAMSEHKSRSMGDGVDFRDNWFTSAVSRMKDIGLRFRPHVERMKNTLPSIENDDAKEALDIIQHSA